MKKSLVLAAAMALGVTASAYAANPFSDVPAGHWAYDSIDKLAAAGIIEGMGDGTYQGDRNMTRYEMAQIVAKAMAKGANVDKLAAEFADELDALGVRVAALEKKADNVKISGQVRYHYNRGYADTKGSASQLRSRIVLKGQINEDWNYTARFQNVQNFRNDVADEGTRTQMAYVSGKLGGLKVDAGRYNMTDITGGNIYDTRFDGVQAKYGKKLALTVGAGKANGDSAATPFANAKVSAAKSVHTVYATASCDLGKSNLHAGYYKFDDCAPTAGLDNKIWTVGAKLGLSKSLNLTADYMNSNQSIDGDDDAIVLGLNYKGAKASQVGSYGLAVKHYDQAEGTYVAHTMNGTPNVVSSVNEGFDGWMYGAYVTVAKNMILGVEYYDLEGKQTGADNKNLWTQMVMTF